VAVTIAGLSPPTGSAKGAAFLGFVAKRLN
jgi:hypothetical protein